MSLSLKHMFRSTNCKVYVAGKENETALAVLFNFQATIGGDPCQVQMWLPKSEFRERDDYVLIPQWLFQQKVAEAEADHGAVLHHERSLPTTVIGELGDYSEQDEEFWSAFESGGWGGGN